MAGFVKVRIPLYVRRRVTMVPALVVLALGANPTDALVLSQVVLSFGIPFALIPLVILTSRRDVMGVHVNRRATTVLAWSCAVLITGLNVFLLPAVLRVARPIATLRAQMALADNFQQIVDALPDDWTDLELDLRIFDERRYVDAAVLLVDLQRPALLEERLALAAAGGAPVRPRRRRCRPSTPRCTSSTRPGSTASWPSARSAPGASRSPRCGAGPSRCARSSASSTPSRGTVARVVAFVPDLLFGSNVVGALQAAGHEPVLVSASRPSPASWPGAARAGRRSDRQMPPERIEQVSAAAPGRAGRSRSTRTWRPTCGPRPSRPGSTWSSRGRGWRARARRS